MGKTIDNLNFKVILDDKDFDTRVKADIELAKKLNVELSTLLQAKVNINKISAQDAASAKRASDILTKQAKDQEAVNQAKAKTAKAEEEVATQAAKTSKELERAKTATGQTILNAQRLVTETQRTAKETNNAAASAQRLKTETQRTATEVQRTATATQNAANATARAELAQKRLADYSRQTARHIQTQSRLMSELKGYALGYLSIHGASQLISSLVRVTGEFELQKTTLAAMLGDLNKAEGVLTRIQALAVESPFQFKELTTYAKQLSAFSVPAEELYETTKMLADISAGLGVGMDRIVLAYGQVRSAAFLRGQEVRQFTEAGIPILDELAKQFTELEGRAVSTGEVFDKISARLVPFEMVAKVFKDMTAEGGKFYQMQEIQAETLRGKLSNLKDAYEVMLNEIGSAHSDKLKGAVDWVKNLMQNWESVGGQLIDLIKLFGLYKGAVAMLRISDTIAKFGGLAAAIRKTAAAQALMNSALLTNPYIAVGMAVATVVLAINRQRKALNDTTWAQNEYNKRVKELAKIDRERAAAIRSLIDVARDETQATIERESALISLKEAYPEIFAQYDLEALKLADILSIKKQIAEEDAKQKKVEAYGAIGAQKGRVKALIARGASDNHVESALAIQREMEKDYLKKYILPDIVAGLKNMTNDALQESLNEAFRKSKYNIRGVETFEDIQTTPEFYQDLVAAIQAEIRKRQSVKLVEGWRKQVQDALKKLGLDKGTSFGLWAEDTTQSTQYVEDMVKRYKEINEQIKLVSPFDKEQTDRLKQNKTAIETIAKALKIDIKELAASKSEKAESKEEKRIKRLVEALRTLQDQYEKLKALGASDESIKKLFKGLYPELIAENGEEFATDLNYLERAVGLIEELEKIAPEDAKKLLVNIGKDEFSVYVKTLEKQEKAYKKTAKAAGEYFNELRKWASEDFTISGEGVAMDVSKISSELKEKINKIQLQAQKAKELFGQIEFTDGESILKVKKIFIEEFGEDSWDEFWNAYYTNGLDAIDRLATKQTEYEKKLAQERVNDLAQKYVNETYFTEGIKLTDLGDKTLSQIRRLKKKLQDIITEDPLQIPIELQNKLKESGVDVKNLIQVELEEIYKAFEKAGTPIDASTQAMLNLIKQIQTAGLKTENFGEIIKKVFKGDLEELTEEEGKLLSEMIKGYLGEMQGLFESIGDFAEKIGNDELQGAMNGIAQSMEILGGVADRLAKGDWIGAIISGVTSLANVVMDALSAQEELNKSIAETRREMLLLASENAIGKNVESIFGTDDYKKFQNAYDEAVKAHKQALEDMERQNKQMLGGGKDDWGQWGTIGAAGAGAALGAAVGSIVPAIGTAIGAGVGALVGMIVGLVGNAATEANNYVTSLQEMADAIGGDLVEEDTGTFNVETLKKIKETYTDLDSTYQEILDNLIAHAEVFENAIVEMSTYMTDMFGQCADDMADAFIESFKTSGEAALEYGDTIADVATNIAKSMIKSTILQNVWDDEKSREAAKMLASGNAAGAMKIVDEAMQSAEALLPEIQDFLESMQPYFEMGEEETTPDLGEGVKGITEDTANLLASYLNAIRTDVSYAKTLWVRMDGNLQKIADFFASSPTLMEYQAQIAANTYNSAQATQSILAELRSVISTDGGDTAIRVYS